MCVCVCVCVCVCILSYLQVPWEAEDGTGPLELEVQIVVSCPIGVMGTRESSQVL